jgi:hypothetical protein
LQDYSYFNQQTSNVPSMFPTSQKADTMDEGPNKFTPPQGKKPTDNLEFKYRTFCCLLLVLCFQVSITNVQHLASGPWVVQAYESAQKRRLQ